MANGFVIAIKRTEDDVADESKSFLRNLFCFIFDKQQQQRECAEECVVVKTTNWIRE
jgi:hypothetical protein